MNEWLLLLLVPLGGAALAQLVQDDDDSTSDGPDYPQGTSGDDDLTADDQNGVINAGAGNDTLTATNSEPCAEAVSYNATTGEAFWRQNIHSGGSADFDWHSSDDYPLGTPDLGLTALRGGAVDDSITGTGPSMDLDGGSGNDSLFLQSDHDPEDSALWHAYGIARGGAGHDQISASGSHLIADGDSGNDRLSLNGDQIRAFGGAGNDWLTGSGVDIRANGGLGNDTISLNGSGHRVDGGEGDDSLSLSGDGGSTYGSIDGGDGADYIRVSGSGMVVSGGAESNVPGGVADTLDVSGLTDSEIHLHGDDVLLNYGDSNTGMTFYLSGGHGLQGNASDERVRVEGQALVDGGAGDDTLTSVSYYGEGIQDGATLLGGAGDDSLNGAGREGSIDGGGSDGYDLRVGFTNDVLDGGDGDDAIRFDNDDTVTGGAGADDLTGFVDSEHHSVVTDFTAGQDRLHVYLNPEDIAPDLDFVDPDDYRNVSVQELNGHTVIALNGIQALTVQNATGLNIGLRYDDPQTGESSWTDLDGNPVDPDALDVELDMYR